MNLDHLLAFVEAARSGNISAAARRLGKSQSATSTAIANLEVDLGVALFDRSGHKARLSGAGEELLGHAEIVLKVSENLDYKAVSLRKGEEGHITIAVDDSPARAALVALLIEFEATFPLVNVDLLRPSPTDIVSLVTDEAVNAGIAISQTSAPTAFFARTVGHVQFVPVASRGHPLACLETVNNDDLAQYRQVHTVGQSGVQSPFPNVYSQLLWRVEHHAEAIELVAAGLGWSIVPEHLLAARADLVEINHAYHKGAFLVPIDLIWPKRSRPGPAVRWIIDHMARFL